MSDVLGEFNDEQRFWYACVLGYAAKADGVVHYLERDILYKPFYFLNDENKQKVLQLIKEQKVFEIIDKIPEGMTSENLFHVFIDVIRLVCIDAILHEDELAYLNHLAELFEIEENQLSEVMGWAENVRKLEEERKYLQKLVKFDKFL